MVNSLILKISHLPYRSRREKKKFHSILKKKAERTISWLVQWKEYQRDFFFVKKQSFVSVKSFLPTYFPDRMKSQWGLRCEKCSRENYQKFCDPLHYTSWYSQRASFVPSLAFSNLYKKIPVAFYKLKIRRISRILLPYHIFQTLSLFCPTDFLKSI